MKELQKQLLELMHKSKQDPATSGALYGTLIEEEHEEFQWEAMGSPEEYKELCDLLWVIIQYANTQGYDLEKGIQALVEEYNSKFLDADGNFNPIFREDGKLLKGPLFKKANFKELLNASK